ncbi:MAG: rhamnulokinase [Sedimentisphaerales bacterium]|nr:rhamnulokinase [Sedimentisphaerales bacterium]
MTKINYIAVDLGAESGRVMIGSLAGGRLTLTEAHRFVNGPITEDGALHWDFGRTFGEIKTGIARAVKMCDGVVAGIAVDSWGVDYGLIGADGKLLENPYHYRDGRTDDMLDEAFKLISKRAIYENTGLQFMALNTAYQLLACRLQRPELLQKAKSLIFTADLYAYYLCGSVFAEYSLASTSQLMDMRSGSWSATMFDKLQLPMELMPKVVQPGTVVGKLTPEIAAEFGCSQIPVIAIGSHDTASAVAAVPADDSQGTWAYLSSGTWSLMGVETPRAIINDKTFEYQFTNEGGVENTIRLLKNIMGLWVLQECRRQWQRDGEDLSYGQIAKMAQEAEPFVAFIDPAYGDLFKPGDMPGRIQQYLKQTNQPAITDKGQLARAILEGLALKYRQVMGWLEDIVGHEIDRLHIVGGGIQNELLCQFTANALDKTVVTGPVEATALGNILMQAIATGDVASLDEARKIVGNSYELKTYSPADTDVWKGKCDEYIK